jgi:hypothetical protein
MHLVIPALTSVLSRRAPPVQFEYCPVFAFEL